MKMATLTWRQDDEGHVNYTKDFEDSNVILRLDFLNDVIHDLTNTYNLTLDGMAEELKKESKENE